MARFCSALCTKRICTKAVVPKRSCTEVGHNGCTKWSVPKSNGHVTIWPYPSVLHCVMSLLSYLIILLVCVTSVLGQHTQRGEESEKCPGNFRQFYLPGEWSPSQQCRALSDVFVIFVSLSHFYLDLLWL